MGAVKAAVFQGPGRIAWQDAPDPGIADPADVIVTSSTPVPLRMVAAGRLSPAELITRRFEPGVRAEAYEVFGRAAETGAIKVALGGPQHTVVSLPDAPAA